MARIAHRYTPRRIARRSPQKRVVRKSRSTTKKVSFLRPVLLAVCTIVGLYLASLFVWFLVLPSVLLTHMQERNVVYVSNTLDDQNNIILFAQFNDNVEKSTVFAIDGTVEVTVPNGYGTYALESLYPLLKMDKREDETIRSIMSRALAVPVDALVVGEPLVAEGFSKQMARASVWNAVTHMPLKTAQEYLTLLRMYFLLGATEEVPLFSTAEVSGLTDQAALVLVDGEETCSVAVVNTTKTAKLAATTAALLERNGVYVIREDSIPHTVPTTSIHEKSEVKKEACASLADKLQSFFPATTTKSTQNKDTDRYRADIVILLGEDVVTTK